MGHFCSKFGGLGQHPPVEFFFFGLGFFCKITVFASLCKFLMHPPLFMIVFIIPFIVQNTFNNGFFVL